MCLGNDAKEIWSRIDHREINKILSSEYLEILETLLDREPEETPLKDDRSEKAEIYKLSVLSKLHSNQFRKKIFSYLTKEELREISKEINLPITKEDVMRKNLLKVPWNNNQKALKIADFIGVPSFMLEIYAEEGKSIPEEVCPWILKYDSFLNPPKEKELLESEFNNKSPFKTLKSFQARAHQDVLEEIGINYGRCILNMPTGTGKTRTAMETVCSYLLEHKNHTVVWVAHTRELLDQAALEFSQIWEFLGDRKIKIIRHYAGKSKKITEESIFVVISFQTLLKNISDFSEVPIGLIVIDEAHITTAKKWGKVVSDLIKPEFGTKILGLTATPVRTASAESKKLARFYNNRLIQPTYKHDKGIIEYFIEEGILARAKYDKVSEKESFALSKSQIEKLMSKEISDFPKEFLERLAKNGSRNLAITKKLKEILGKPEDKRQILFFALNVKHSRMIMTWLLKNNYSAFHLDTNVDPHSRKSCIEAFKSGKLRVLCNYGILSTGFDAPKVDCIFIARPTTSHVLHSQMVGRGLRGPKLGGTPSCLVVEVEDNIKNFPSDLRVSFENYIKAWKVSSEDLTEEDIY